jgi:hypothetical protein
MEKFVELFVRIWLAGGDPVTDWEDEQLVMEEYLSCTINILCDLKSTSPVSNQWPKRFEGIQRKGETQIKWFLLVQQKRLGCFLEVHLMIKAQFRWSLNNRY